MEVMHSSMKLLINNNKEVLAEFDVIKDKLLQKLFKAKTAIDKINNPMA